MKIKNITQISFLAFMLGMTGSLSSLNLAQAAKEDKESKPVSSESRSSENPPSREVEKSSETVMSSYHMVKSTETSKTFSDENGNTVEIHKLDENTTSVKVTDPFVAKATLERLTSSDLQKTTAVLEMSPSAPETLRSGFAAYAKKEGLSSTTDKQGVSSISAKGPAAQKLVEKVAEFSRAKPRSSNSLSSLDGASLLSNDHTGPLLSGNHLSEDTTTLTLSGSHSGNMTRTNTTELTLSGNQSGNMTSTVSGENRTSTATGGNITGNNDTSVTVEGNYLNVNITIPAAGLDFLSEIFHLPSNGFGQSSYGSFSGPGIED